MIDVYWFGTVDIFYLVALAQSPQLTRRGRLCKMRLRIQKHSLVGILMRLTTVFCPTRYELNLTDIS